MSRVEINAALLTGWDRKQFLSFAEQAGQTVNLIYIDKVKAKGRPYGEILSMDCAICDSETDYKRGKLVRFLSGDRLVVVENIMGYRCSDDKCEGSISPWALHPDVTDEFRERLESTSPVKVLASYIRSHYFTLQELRAMFDF